MRGRIASRFGGKAKVAAVAVGLLLAGLGAGAFSQVSAAASGLLKVRLGGDAAETRLVVDLDRSVSGKLISDGAADGTIVVSFPKMAATGQLKGNGQGVVRRWTVEPRGGGAQLNIELAGKAQVARRFLLPPGDGVPHYRYVIDLKSTGGGRIEPRPARVLAPMTTLEPVAIRSPRASGKKVIVIDAGHGGHDPGAIGKASHEKDVTLAAAKALKARLERSGRYTVILTRDRDVYVELEGRVKIARRADADLFISLHADAGPDTLSGASVYTLSEKGERRVGKVLAKDDWLKSASMTGGDRSVGDILLDLTQRSTKNRSAIFAEMLVEEVSDVAPMLRRSHRDANLVVLLAPDVPAVLLEMGFITSASDERRLTSPRERTRMVDSIAATIDRWFARGTQIASR